jgi:hypothetical protein
MKYKNETERLAWERLRKSNPYIYTYKEMLFSNLSTFICSLILGIFLGLFLMTAAYGSELKHTWKSPVFTGNGYSQHVLTIENLTFQRKQDIKAKEEAKRKEAAREAENTNLNKFLKNFESRVYAELSKQLSEKLFGEAAEESGIIKIMGNTVEYNTVGDEVSLVVTAADGTVTTLVIPTSGFGF